MELVLIFLSKALREVSSGGGGEATGVGTKGTSTISGIGIGIGIGSVVTADNGREAAAE